jgi:hypothetical protein
MRLVLLTLLLSISQAAPPVPRQAVKDHTEKTGTKTQVTKDNQQPTTPLPSSAPIDVSASPNGTTDTPDNQTRSTNPGTKKDKSWSRGDELSLVYDVLTGLLVIVGGAGVCFALRTLRAIERQTGAIERQTKIQSNQHVLIGNWHMQFVNRQSTRIKVSFEIRNDTDFPLTVTKFDLIVGSTPDSAPIGITIIPETGHWLKFEHALSDSDQRDYMADGFQIGVRGAVTFVGIDPRPVVQAFGGILTVAFRIDGHISFESVGSHEQSAKERYSNKPSDHVD